MPNTMALSIPIVCTYFFILRHISAPVMSSFFLPDWLIITVSNEQATDNNEQVTDYLSSAFYCILRFIPYVANSIKVVFQKA